MIKYIAYIAIVAVIGYSLLDGVSGIMEQHNQKTIDTIERVG